MQPYFIFDISGIIITCVFVINNVSPDGLALLVLISNYIHYKVWGGITCPFPNGCTVDVWEWISNSIPHFTGHVITFPYTLSFQALQGTHQVTLSQNHVKMVELAARPVLGVDQVSVLF